MTTTYLRSKDEVCNIVSYSKHDYNIHYDYEYPPIIKSLKHGDIAYISDSYRSQNSIIKSQSEGLLEVCRYGPGNGSGGIPKIVTKYIENPIKFYTQKAIYAGDIAIIELDTIAHMSLLREYAV